jgi:LysR family transcriptional regulator, cyn operon transcriptional activator
MELRHLRYFTALAECLSFTRAAQRVHVTQSTLSHQIRQLEDEVGRPLFDRVGKRVVLTEAGEVFVAFAAKALREVDQGLGLIREASPPVTGTLRIGATHTFNIRFIPDCVAAFLERFPTVKVVVDELEADGIGEKLMHEALDVGIAYRPGGTTELWFEPLYHEEMVLVVSDAHPLAQRKRIRMAELHRQRVVLLPTIFATRVMLDECFAAAGAEPVVAAEMNTIAPMLGLVGRTTIAAIVARNAVPAGLGLRLVPIESPTPMRTPGILWKRGREEQPPIRAFAAILRRTALRESLRLPAA